MIPLTNALDSLRNLRNGRLVSLSGVAHVPQEDAPARSLAPVISFLKR